MNAEDGDTPLSLSKGKPGSSAIVNGDRRSGAIVIALR